MISLRSRRLALLPAAAVVALGLSACGSDEGSTDDTPVSAPASTGPGTAAAEFNDADVEFSQGMIAHHEQAIEMAELALDPNAGARAEVVDLATRISGAQDAEIDLMTGWLTTWGEPIEMDTSEDHDMSSMDGMMTAEEMDALAAATGPEFDTMWLTMMIAHHEGAINQANEVKSSGSNAETLALSDQIITAQEGEIAEMQQLLES